MGYGVDCGSRFSDLLEAKYPNFDVMNFGLSGTGTDQQLLIYENIAKPFEADLYVFAPCTIDIIRNELEFMPSLARQPFYTPKPYFTLDEDRLILHNVPVPRTRLSEEDAKKSETSIHRDTSPYVTRIFRALPQWMRESETFDRIALAVRQSYSAYQSESSKSWRLMRAIIKQFIREVNGKPVFVLPMPTYHHFILKLAPTYVARFAELHDPKGNCFVIDVLPYFERLSPENRRKCRLVNDPGSHYSPQGHKVVANAISDALAEYCPNMLD
jgi:carbamoyltransferase